MKGAAVLLLMALTFAFQIYHVNGNYPNNFIVNYCSYIHCISQIKFLLGLH